jgi:hypothetical protein
MSRRSIPVELAGKQISNAFYGWLSAEVKSSGIDNTYLDDYTEARRRLALGYNTDENWSAEKQESHLNRLEKIWWPPFVEQPQDDEQSANIEFSSLMFVSGAYRIQCYVQSQTPEEYDARRGKAIGINMRQVVVEHLANILPPSGNFSHANIVLQSRNTGETTLEDRKQAIVSEIGETTVKNVCERLYSGKDLGLQDSPSVQEMLKAQKGWIEFATDSVALAAKMRRGELAAVPFLEPKSTSAKPVPKVIYPLDPNFSGF